MFTILIFLIILSILVLIHEAGHFFVARRFGIKVEEFGFGLPPRLFGKKIGETIYSINLLPIGGFVKLFGEDEAGAGRVKATKDQRPKTKDQIKRAFFARPVWQRALVVIAGVAMNFLLAVVIISYLFGVSGVTVPGDKVIVSQVVKNSPADKAGLKKNWVIESVNNVKVTNPDELVKETKKYLGEKIILRVSHDSKVENIEVMPRKDYPATEGPMGIAISQDFKVKKYPWYQAPIVGTIETFKNSWLILSGLGTVVAELVTRGSVPKGVAGPVGIAQLTGQFVQIGPLAVLSFMALLSLNLAILNVLPIPALDGGRLFFILIEGITGKKVSQKFESTAHAIGMAILLALIALITFQDLVRVFKGIPLLPK